MAKSPKKSRANSRGGSRSQAPYNKDVPPKVGGKKIKAYKKNFVKPPQRRFSIADTSSSGSNSESENGGQYNYYETNNYNSGSDSDSSLTAVTDNDEAEASRKGSVFFERADNEELYKPTKKSPKKSKQTNKNTYQPTRSAKKSNNIAKKRTPKKTVNWNQWDNQLNEDAISERSESSSDEEKVGLGGLYSMMNHQKQTQSDSDDSESESDEEEHDYSSSDDSDVDFVKLQAERKAKSMKAVRAMKGLSNQQEDHYQDDSDSEISEPIPEKKMNRNRRRSSSMSKPKFGRRKSDVALPDINFKFEFDDYNKFDNAIIDEEDEEDEPDGIEKDQASSDGDKEEDIGEEVSYAAPINKKQYASNDNDNNDNATNHNFEFDFDFNTQLPQVPRINDTELNSDEDYEIDDNELLATLQADNDMDQFSAPNNTTTHTRNNSIGSYGDEEENDPFLKEEEKFLVNEFENNGFDEDDSVNVGSFDYNDPSDRDNLIDSFNVMTANQNKDVIQYASSADSKSDEEYESDEDDEDEYDDFIDFDAPLFDKDEEDDYDVYEEFKVNDHDSRKHLQHKKKRPKSRKRTNGIGNSDEEDDSYLWNYFFSSDNSSLSGEDEENYRYDDSEEKVIMEKLFKNMEKENRSKKLMRRKNKLMALDKNHYIQSDNGYESGESTDVDLSLPPSTDKKSGSKMAKEVLSSKTADYRPPVLGTWAAIDSKPFGIIDGLSTRSLGSNATAHNSNNKQMEPRLLSRKGIAPIHTNTTTDDLALGLDELLNVSELDDDDENDAKIWRDFNNQKKQVPLGAFRNKSILQNQLIHPENVTVPNNSSYNHTSKSNNEFNKRRYSLSNHQDTGSWRNNLATKYASVKKPVHDRKSSLSHLPTPNLDSPNKNVPSKLKRRRASIVEAVSEGLRPTKSGLFSEDALADVEEILGEDTDLMGLIKGL